MAYKNLLWEVKDRVGYVTINRPDKLNALNSETIEELRQLFHSVSHDAGVGVVILTGSGPKAFVAGADIGELALQTPLTGKELCRKGQSVFNMIENLGKPVIAAVNGFALGGGCELAMSCTLRIASDNAKFGQPEVNLGIIPGYAGTQRLSRLVGKTKAMEMILTGDAIDANEALRIGLVNKVVPQAELLAACEKIARTMLSKGPVAIKCGIEAINRGLETSFDEGCILEANLFGIVCSTHDMKEGLNAFLEKRKAEFKGM